MVTTPTSIEMVGSVIVSRLKSATKVATSRAGNSRNGRTIITSSSLVSVNPCNDHMTSHDITCLQRYRIKRNGNSSSLCYIA